MYVSALWSAFFFTKTSTFAFYELFLPAIPDLIAILVVLVVSLRTSLPTEVAARLGSKPGLPEQADDEHYRNGGHQGRHDRVVHLDEEKKKKGKV